MPFTLGNVSLAYPGGIEVFRQLSLNIPAGLITAVIGPSGSGKTTFLRLLSLLGEWPLAPGNLLYRDGAEVFDYGALGPRARADLRLRRFGSISPGLHLFPHLSCLDNLALPLRLQGVPAREARENVERVLQAIDPRGDLLTSGNRPVRYNSAGARQRFSILRALVHDPAVVFADEPTINLDPNNVRRMLDVLRSWQAGKLFPQNRRPRTLIVASHDVTLMREVADRFILFSSSREVSGPFNHASLLESPNL